MARHRRLQGHTTQVEVGIRIDGLLLLLPAEDTETTMSQEAQGEVEVRLGQSKCDTAETAETTDMMIVVTEVSLERDHLTRITARLMLLEDYPRDAPPAPRDDRRSRPTGPTPPPRQGDHSERRRQASPLRRTERDQRHEEERGRNAREEEPSRLERQASSHGQGEGEDEEDGEVIEDPEADMMAAMGFGGFRTTKVSGH